MQLTGAAAVVGGSQWAVAQRADVVNVIGVGPNAIVNWNFGPGLAAAIRRRRVR